MTDQERRRDEDEEEEPILPVTGSEEADDELSELEELEDEEEAYDSLDLEGLGFRASELKSISDKDLEDGDITPTEISTGILENDASDEGMISDEALLDIKSMNASTDRAREEAARYTDDEEIKDVFEERQSLAGGRGQMIEGLIADTGRSPELAANDVDADWSEQGADETIGGTNPIPDQDVVDDIGKGAGLTYADDEELDYSKVNRRDEHRWELDPASVESELDREDSEEEDNQDLSML